MSATHPPWTKLDCDSCGMMFLYTRTEPRPKPGPGEALCPECRAYEKGRVEGETRIVELEHERDELRAALDDMALNAGKGRNYSGRLLKCMAERYGAQSACEIMRTERDALKAENERLRDSEEA